MAPMYATVNGIDNINRVLQDIFNPPELNKREIKCGEVTYRENDKVLQLVNDPDNNVFNGGFDDEEDNSLYRQAVKIVISEKKTSISYLQRKLRIGYNKAANFIEQMETDGIVSSPDPSGRRVLIKEDNV